MLILLTTANFPDVMLPAYERNYFYAWVFVVYFTVAFYFLFNILTASIFSLFRDRLEKKASQRIERRIQNIDKCLQQFKTKEKLAMTRDEAKDFFSDIFNLSYSSTRHRTIYRRIIKSMPEHEQDSIPKEYVINFFARPNFLEVTHIIESG